MKSSVEIASLIIKRFKEKSIAQGKRNVFKYAGETKDGVNVFREAGTVWEVKTESIIKAIEAVRQEPQIYNSGPSRLRPYINNRRQSPLWALLRLVPLNTILDK